MKLESAAKHDGNGATPDYLMRTDGARIAYRRVDGRAPTVVFLGGFSSDMTGTKASHLDAWCRARGQAYLRFDYQGHGASSGSFVDGTIGVWRDDARAIIEDCSAGPLVLVGSSMGAWIMLLLACALPERLQALVGLASAPDFTEELIWGRLPDEQRQQLMREGVIRVPSAYTNEGTPITRKLIEDGRRHLLLGGTIPINCPVRLLHGLRDTDVPWTVARRLLDALASTDVTLELVKSGDHRLSTPADLARMTDVVGALLESRRDAR